MKRKDDPLAEPWNELTSAQATVTADIEAFVAEAAAQAKALGRARRRDNAGLNAARAALHPLADRCRDLTKQIDLAAKLAGRVIDIAVKELASAGRGRLGECRGQSGAQGAGRSAGRGGRGAAEARYFVKQADWLQERFPDAVLRDVEGLVKLRRSRRRSRRMTGA